MSLYLVQHGICLPREVDPERGLSEEGMAEVERVAIKAREMGLKVPRIIHSDKKRALQTAETLAALLMPGRHPEAAAGLNPMDDAAAFAGTLSTREDLMIVGHMPFLERLSACLITGSTERPVIRFANSGIVCLLYDEAFSAWVVGWSLTPEMA